MRIIIGDLVAYSYHRNWDDPFWQDLKTKNEIPESVFERTRWNIEMEVHKFYLIQRITEELWPPRQVP